MLPALLSLFKIPSALVLPDYVERRSDQQGGCRRR